MRRLPERPRKGGYNPNKAREGVALVLALAVVLVGGVIVGLTFDFVYGFSWISNEQRGGYVDHTTALSVIQAKIAQIVEANNTAGKTMHVPALGYDNGVVLSKDNSLTLSDLRFGSPWSDSVEMSSGSGPQRVVTDVFDMHFMPQWVNYDAFSGNPADMKDFPPVFNMEGKVGSGGYNPDGDHTGPGAGSGGVGDADDLDPDSYGAYLIRVRLFDHQGKLLRTAEEVFVQILDR
jgi:hypothetical protein